MAYIFVTCRLNCHLCVQNTMELGRCVFQRMRNAGMLVEVDHVVQLGMIGGAAL